MGRPVRLILVRHGLTDANASRRFLGHGDPPLNAEGLRQARRLARRLARRRVLAIASSDLERCRQTAAVIAAPHGLAVHTDPRLREIHFGAVEGLTYAEAEARFPGAVGRVWSDPEGHAFPGGEGLPELRRRVWEAVRAFAARIEGEGRQGVGVVVTHGGPIRAVLSALWGCAFWDAEVAPGAMVPVELRLGRGVPVARR